MYELARQSVPGSQLLIISVDRDSIGSLPKGCYTLLCKGLDHSSLVLAAGRLGSLTRILILSSAWSVCVRNGSYLKRYSIPIILVLLPA